MSEFYSFDINPGSNNTIYLRLKVDAFNTGPTATAYYTVYIPNGGNARTEADSNLSPQATVSSVGKNINGFLNYEEINPKKADTGGLS